MRIAVLPGDGIGHEVCNEAMKVLRAVGHKFGHAFEINEFPVGWEGLDAHGQALPDHVLEACRAHDAVFLGAVGLPDRDQTLPQDRRPERAVLLPLREGNWANLRPVWLPPCMAKAGQESVDILIFRELNGGIYTGNPRGRREVNGVTEGFDTMRYSVPEIERIARLAFEAARTRRKEVLSVDKANILATSALWREVVVRIGAEFPDVTLRHQYVDSAAPLMIQHPDRIDVLLTGNLFGDILSDLGGALVGSLGMLPSACIGGKIGLYEPAHGSAPDIAGRDLANPIASILTVEMMLEHSFGLHEEARAVNRAVVEVLATGARTGDIMAQGCRQVGCAAFGDLTAERI